MLKEAINIEQLDILKKGSYLWVWDGNASPPHIGLSVEGQYYSLRFTKKDHQPIEEALEKVKRLPISFLWIEVDSSAIVLHPNDAFEPYSSCLDQNVSCLQPILDTFQIPDKSYILKDLLEYLNRNKQILNVFSHRLPASWRGLSAYTNQDVQANLEAAKSKLCHK